MEFSPGVPPADYVERLSALWLDGVTLPLGVDQESITSGVQQDQGIREVCSGPHRPSSSSGGPCRWLNGPVGLVRFALDEGKGIKLVLSESNDEGHPMHYTC
ncbi:unnamed protein product [Arctogadus glacialis]